MTMVNAQPISLITSKGLDPSLSKKEQARKSAEEFEAVFINQMLSTMFEGVGENDYFGGSYETDTYRGLLTETYADAISKSGGLGIADNIMRELISLQEMEE